MGADRRGGTRGRGRGWDKKPSPPAPSPIKGRGGGTPAAVPLLPAVGRGARGWGVRGGTRGKGMGGARWGKGKGWGGCSDFDVALTPYLLQTLYDNLIIQGT